MRILFITHAFNSLTQRLYVELKERNHEVSVEFDINDTVSMEAVELFKPDLIVAPFLKRAISEAIWSKHVCFIVHPGIRGDRGPSSLDWAILNNEGQWGVTVLQANAEMDAGDIWASFEFKMHKGTKASLYRNEVTEAAVDAVLEAVDKYSNKEYKAESLDYRQEHVRGELRPLMQQDRRAIDWLSDDTETVLRKIRCADGFPGVRDQMLEQEYYLFDAHAERELKGEPGNVIAKCGPAICRATIDGAVWIGHLKDKQSDHLFKLPATQVLQGQLEALPEVVADERTGYRDIWYEEDQQIGYLHFPFYNGAMSTAQCNRLRDAYCAAREQDTKIIVLMGGPDYWSNGMHLNVIESADSTADESWLNINAIDDLASEIINTESQITVAALQGNAGAGGVFLARATSKVWARKGVILNPHYKDMGNLYGSEYWTYLLPKYVGEENVQRITQGRLPMGSQEALALGLIDDAFSKTRKEFVEEVKVRATNMAERTDFSERLSKLNKQRVLDEKEKPLAQYRDQELERMRLNFYGFDPSYHVARYNFVYKIPKSRTPITIARHRDKNIPS